MAGNSFGNYFRITTFGESHGPAVGVVIDGCPAGLTLNTGFIQSELNKRRPGFSALSSQRKEEDSVRILSGVFDGKTTGTPLALMILNKDSRPEDYEQIKDVFRPSHADFTYERKYGIRDYRGGGRASARETAARVMAGAVAKQLLLLSDIRIAAFVKQTGPVKTDKQFHFDDLEKRWDNEIRCPDPETAAEMIRLIEQTRQEGDSLGGIISVVVKGCPVGLGQPVFDKLQADLAKAMLSIPSVHGFEYGSGFDGASKKGSENNDAFETDDSGNIITTTNHSGGIQGGISNAMDILFNVAFKPVSGIKKSQKTVSHSGQSVDLSVTGRHDPCVLPRAVVVVEAMAALVLADHWLRMRTDRI